MAILPATGGGLRSHDAATGFPFPVARCPRVSSNVAQSYPYSSESEPERAGRLAALVSEREGLADTLTSEATPLGELEPDQRWWVWKCPTKGCPGLLHVAGYAFEKHGLFVVCDGTCAKTFLR
jgi:hypothetical protein